MRLCTDSHCSYHIYTYTRSKLFNSKTDIMLTEWFQIFCRFMNIVQVFDSIPNQNLNLNPMQYCTKLYAFGMLMFSKCVLRFHSAYLISFYVYCDQCRYKSNIAQQTTLKTQTAQSMKTLSFCVLLNLYFKKTFSC